ncbi:MAG: thiol reductase thioredoxin, partial [Gammaproteobacteria bacterium]|nr:thiol reductase thioredoxin [Gammaproteobacteria bacterium]
MSKFSDIIGRDSLTLVDFYADWCGPCKTMAPVLDQLKAHYGDRLTVLKINIDN